MLIIKITKYTLGFRVEALDPIALPTIVAFASRFVQKALQVENGISKMMPVAMFASSNVRREYFNFHIGVYSKFLESMAVRGYTEGVDYTVEETPLYTPRKVDLNLNPKFVLREIQDKAKEFVKAKMLGDVVSTRKLVGIQTGGGKTLTGCAALADIKELPVVIIRNQFIEKWEEDFNKYFGIAKKDIYTVNGAKSLQKLIKLGMRKKLRAKAIIISNKTYQMFITDFEDEPNDFYMKGYACTPYEFFEKIQAGVLLRDEIHLDFHFNFKIDTYSNVPLACGLSATLLNDSPFIENMYAIMYPMNLRFMGEAIKKYVDAYAVMYHIENLNHVRTSYSRGGFYSHNAFEESVLKRPSILKNYTKLIESVINTTYIKNTRAKKRLVVFASTVAMCTHLAEAFKKTWPHLDIRRYVSADPYENMLESDIRVTTLGSGSTAHDVPDLTTVILTQAVNSVQSNIQSLGRLRLLDNESTFEFAYFVCVDIKTHINYHRGKLLMLKERAKAIRTINTGVVI